MRKRQVAQPLFTPSPCAGPAVQFCAQPERQRGNYDLQTLHSQPFARAQDKEWLCYKNRKIE
jgi:hypothetical protein